MSIAPQTMQQAEDPLACLLNTHPETAFDYLEFRSLLAGEAAAMAAERASQADLQMLRRRMEAVQTAHALNDPEQEATADAAFHLAIYEAAHNVVMLHIMRRLLEMLSMGVFYNRADLYLRRGVRDNFLRQHQAIYDAIAARQPQAAKAAADAHLRSTAESLREAQKSDYRREVAVRRAEGGLLVSHKPRGQD